MPSTASGINHQNLSISTSKATPIQYSPVTKKPKPKHQPRKNALRRRGTVSLSQIREGNEISNNGVRSTGGKAAAAIAPISAA